MVNAPDGLHLVGGFVGSDTLFFDSLFRTYPAEVGASWPSVRLAWVTRSEDLTYVADTLTQTLVAVDKILETPAGTFRCHVYKYSFRPAPDVASIWDVYDYYAPRIGRVAEIVEDYGIRDPGDRGTIQAALLYGYHLN